MRSVPALPAWVRRAAVGAGTGAAVVLALLMPAQGAAAAAAGATPDANTVICGTLCDGASADQATENRLADGTGIFGRSIELHVDDHLAMAWAVIGNGDPTDEVWLDRSFDGGKTWTGGSKLGDATIPDGTRSVTTAMYNINDPQNNENGVVRACGKAGNRPNIVCTAWNSTERRPAPTSPARGSVAALVKLYDRDTGLFKTTGWWNSANDLTGVIDYALATGDHEFDWVVANTYQKNLDAQGGQFTNDYIDDTGWWALAWIRAYDLTHDARYLKTAEHDADYMWSYHDGTCGGGLWWNTSKNYKNAVTNELFIKVSAELHNRIPGDTSYLNESLATWNWFHGSGMINDQNMINDGLTTATCTNNGGTTWTYNQGVVLGGLRDLYIATDDRGYLAQARTLAHASTTSTFLNPDGVLTEPCESNGCGGDGPTFKGVYVRNLGELNATVLGRPYQPYLERQAKTSWLKDRNAYNQYGVHWAGPIADISAATQGSAIDAQVAPLDRRTLP